MNITQARRHDDASHEPGQRGFTLVELLVVVLIIGILAAVAIPIFLGQQDSAKNSAVIASISNARMATVAQFTSTGTFPASIAAVGGYSPGTQVTVTLSTGATASAFVVTGVWAADAVAATHRYTINQTGAIVKG